MKMSKKNEKKNEDKKAEDETELAMQQMAANNQQLQGTAQNLANQLQQYMALCSHYEQTINVLTGRVQELKQQISNLSQQGQ
jgi:GTP1/Obg family GTP-binding protein